MDELFEWDRGQMLEIYLDDPENFLKIKESLSRIGIASKRDNILYQSAHILHKQERYYIVHFKEIFRLDGKHSDISYEDIHRRNAIAYLLEEWGLCEIADDPDVYNVRGQLNRIKIISYKDKKNWQLESKVTVGKPKR
jgi:hypothetical protein